MTVSSANAASLADQARRYRLLAAGLSDGDTKATLLALAVEYESACQGAPEVTESRTWL
jgi:hypothetical protein